MENQKTDREIILETLRFIKEKESGEKNYVNPKDSPEFSSLPEETQNRIRDIIVVNRLASISNIGKVWELAITWQPEGGVDLLNKKNIEKILNKDGSFNIWHKGRQNLKKHLIAIIVSVIAGVLGGVFLIWIAPLVTTEKAELSETSENNTQIENKSKVIPGQGQFWIDFIEALDQQNTQYLLEHSLDSIQCVECNLIPEQQSEYYNSQFIFSKRKYLNKLMHLPDLKDANYTIFKDDELIRINYKIKANNSEGGYNLIFKFVRTKDGDFFAGMIVT